MYLIINRLCKKEYIVLDTCFKNKLDSDIGAVYSYIDDKSNIVIVKNDIKAVNDGEIYKKSLKYYTTLAKAKLVVTNNAHHLYVGINKNTVLINTWHGTPYKDVSINKNATKVLNFTNRNTTLHISGNEFFEQTYLNDTIDFKGKIITKGFFRNDILFNDEKFYSDKKFCKNGKKNILICPTWRDYGDCQLIKEMVQLITEISSKYSDKYNLLLRMHNKSEFSEVLKNDCCFNVSNSKYETQKLLKVTDILITDYSSIFFDFALLERPIFLFQFDEELYKKERGLVIKDIQKEYGLSIFRNCLELTNSLDNFDYDEECLKTIKFNKLIGQTETGNSLETIDKYIL